MVPPIQIAPRHLDQGYSVLFEICKNADVQSVRNRFGKLRGSWKLSTDACMPTPSFSSQHVYFCHVQYKCSSAENIGQPKTAAKGDKLFSP